MILNFLRSINDYKYQIFAVFIFSVGPTLLYFKINEFYEQSLKYEKIADKVCEPGFSLSYQVLYKAIEIDCIDEQGRKVTKYVRRN